MKPVLTWTAPLLVTITIGATPVQARELTFEERVEAQRAIEQVYYSHQIEATRPFDEVVSPELLERKVRRYLKQSAALEAFWRTPLTAEVLRREAERIARQTQLPERLRELYEALGNDPVLVQECLVRPLLVDRLTRNFFASDERIHGQARDRAEELRGRLVAGDLDLLVEGSQRTVVDLVRSESNERIPRRSFETSRPNRLELGPEEFSALRRRAPQRVGEIGPVVEEREAFVVRVVLSEDAGGTRIATHSVGKRQWDEWWSGVERHFDETAVATVASTSDVLPEPAAAASSCLPDDTWDNGGRLGEVPDARRSHTAVWTGNVMVVWGGYDDSFSFLNTGSRYDPVTDSWEPTSTENAPAARYQHTAIWTGKVVVVWGGTNGGASDPGLNTGGRYDPVTDTWTSTSTVGAPSPRKSHIAVWTGKVMVVWGQGGGTGGRYDPVLDTWDPTSTTNAPTSRSRLTAVWTGNVVVVWGGFNGADYLDSGGRYDPVADRWDPTSTIGAPSGRSDHTAVWTGSTMIVWGGYDRTELNSGGRYDPVADRWDPMSTTGAPEGRYDHTAVWTGSVMIAWGGLSIAGYLKVGGRYDPVADRWESVSSENEPRGRTFHSAIWTGSVMVVWGGGWPATSIFHNSGGRYDPVADAWTPTADGTTAPIARYLHTAVWTGNVMIVWGGLSGSTWLNVGFRYDPATDTWTPTSTTNAPPVRYSHSAVWSGSAMIVWGGNSNLSFIYHETGGRYDPVSDSWSPTSTVGAPTGRTGHTAVWTGSAMVIWGGYDGTYLGTGARYDPAANVWTSMATGGQTPTGRSGHTAVWTGSEMLAWGGTDGSLGLDSGGRYDPLADRWTSLSSVGAPTGRDSHTAVWTGGVMVVWGGFDQGVHQDTGGRYDPARNRWSPVSTVGAPAGRSNHTAIWTGNLMVVWGGNDSSVMPSKDTGGRYEPASDVWAPTSTVNVPRGRSYHTAVWTGSVMVVWGGLDQWCCGGVALSSGGRYGVGPIPDGDNDGFAICAGDCNDTDPAIHPGAQELCNGVDDNCVEGVDEGGGSILCPDANTCTTDLCGGSSGCLHPAEPDGTSCEDGSSCTTQDSCQGGTCRGGALRDADADAHADSGCGGDDCDDTDPLVWLVPHEVMNLLVSTGSPASLSWDSQASLVGPGILYDLVSGNIPASAGIDFSSSTCLNSDASTSVADARPDPPAREAFWYVVRGRNSCGTGTYGSSQRDGSIPPCP